MALVSPLPVVLCAEGDTTFRLIPEGENLESVRVIAVAVSLAILSGCSDSAWEHTPEERAEFDARIAKDLRAARERRAHQVSDNQRFLDALPVFPGSRFVRETHQGNDESESDELVEEDVEYELYLSEVMEPYWRYELITADRWSTYRAYRLPRTAMTDEVHAYYARLLRDSIASERDRGRHGAGHRTFTDDYWRDGRCVWVHIGGSDQPPIPPRQTLMVATMKEPLEDC